VSFASELSQHLFSSDNLTLCRLSSRVRYVQNFSSSLTPYDFRYLYEDIG